MLLDWFFPSSFFVYSQNHQFLRIPAQKRILKKNNSLVDTKGLFVKPNHQTIRSHWSFSGLIPLLEHYFLLSQVFGDFLSSVTEETLCRQSGKCDIMPEKMPPLTSTYPRSPAGYPSLTLFFWERAINGAAPACIFLREADTLWRCINKSSSAAKVSQLIEPCELSYLLWNMSPPLLDVHQTWLN